MYAIDQEINLNKILNTNSEIYSEKQIIEKEVKNTSPSIPNIDFTDVTQASSYCNRNSKFANDLRILSYLNRGSCGVVLLGEIKKCQNKKVALKLLVSNKVTKSRRDKITKREIQIMNKLKNKNSINLYGIYEVGEKETICMVMEYAKYGDIENFQKLILKKVLNETLLAYITRQILGGLLQCKKNNIIHLDIKHQNILIDEILNAKLSDFSVSYEINKHDFEKGKFNMPLVGTSLFMSPEVLNKLEVKVEDAHKVDIFSLGVLLYNLAFNKYPYELDIRDKKNFCAIESKIRYNELHVPVMSKHSKLFRNFITNCLEKDITKRLSTEDALCHPWIKCADLIFEQKEKMGDLEKFLIILVTDNVRIFNDAIKLFA